MEEKTAMEMLISWVNDQPFGEYVSRQGLLKKACELLKVENGKKVEDYLRGVEKGRLSQVKKDGYAGVLSNGEIVDRRDYPEAFPMQQNSLFGISKPKKL